MVGIERCIKTFGFHERKQWQIGFLQNPSQRINNPSKTLTDKRCPLKQDSGYIQYILPIHVGPFFQSITFSLFPLLFDKFDVDCCQDLLTLPYFS